jgi:hypothetical protein
MTFRKLIGMNLELKISSQREELITVAACLETKCLFMEVTILGKVLSIHCGVLTFPMLDTFKKKILIRINYVGKILLPKVFKSLVLFVTILVFSIAAKCTSLVEAQE